MIITNILHSYSYILNDQQRMQIKTKHLTTSNFNMLILEIQARAEKPRRAKILHQIFPSKACPSQNQVNQLSHHLHTCRKY